MYLRRIDGVRGPNTTIDFFFTSHHVPEQTAQTKCNISYEKNGRDKYMFHQTNVVSTTVPTGTKSLLAYWYEVVLGKMSTFLNLKGADPFPVRVRNQWITGFI